MERTSRRKNPVNKEKTSNEVRWWRSLEILEKNWEWSGIKCCLKGIMRFKSSMELSSLIGLTSLERSLIADPNGYALVAIAGFCCCLNGTLSTTREDNHRDASCLREAGDYLFRVAS